MTIRNIEALLRPTSVALVGASRRTGSVGAAVARNLLRGGFKGPVWPVNPHASEIDSVRAFPSVADLPGVADLAVLCTPPETIPGLIGQLADLGTQAAIIMSAGFGESGPAGQALRQQALDAAQPTLMRLLGPNCLGVIVPGSGLNASFAHGMPRPGDLALVAQSGAVLAGVIDWAAARGIGFSHLISLGGMIDVDAGDLLDYLALDPDVRGILLYLEAATHARKFMSAARHAARIKPVVVVKAGRHEAAAKAAASHTGVLAGSDAVYDAAFRRAGLLRVPDLEDLFDAVETLSTGIRISGDRLAIVTNGGGMGVLATDVLSDLGGRLAPLSDDTLQRLDQAMPRTWSHGNPVDIQGDATPERLAAAVRALIDDPTMDALLVLHSPTAIADGLSNAKAVVESARGRRRPLLTSWLGDQAARPGRIHFQQNEIPTFDTPGDAVRAFMHLSQFARNQQQLLEVPAAITEPASGDPVAARQIVDKAMRDAGAGEGAGIWLSEPDAKALLAAYGIPVVPSLTAPTPKDAAAAATRIGFPVAVKILSPDLQHKSDAGGVTLDLSSAAAVVTAAEDMLARVGAAAPEARLDGFIVQPMARRAGSTELIVGMTVDPLFGPVILFGEGGTAVEVIQDTAVALPPLNMPLALDLIDRTRVSHRLKGYRANPPVDIEAIAAVLIQLSCLTADLPEIAELDVNPLLADRDGVIAVDARIRLAPNGLPGAQRFAIRPYPRALERQLSLRSGAVYTLRPVRPEDAGLLQAMVARTDARDIRLRFFVQLRSLSRQMAARLTQIDYDREMGLVAIEQTAAGDGFAGIVHMAADPDKERAEFGVLVRSDLKGQGLGWALMNEVIAYARGQGVQVLFGQILRGNTGMLQMCRELGFTIESNPEDPELVTATIDLQGSKAGA